MVMAHVLALCCVPAAVHVPEVYCGVKLIERLFSLFRKGMGDSSNKLRAFREGKIVLDTVNNYYHYRNLELVEPRTTRWLTHERAAATIVATLLPLAKYVNILCDNREGVFWTHPHIHAELHTNLDP